MMELRTLLNIFLRRILLVWISIMASNLSYLARLKNQNVSGDQDYSLRPLVLHPLVELARGLRLGATHYILKTHSTSWALVSTNLRVDMVLGNIRLRLLRVNMLVAMILRGKQISSVNSFVILRLGLWRITIIAIVLLHQEILDQRVGEANFLVTVIILLLYLNLILKIISRDSAFQFPPSDHGLILWLELRLALRHVAILVNRHKLCISICQSPFRWYWFSTLDICLKAELWLSLLKQSTILIFCFEEILLLWDLFSFIFQLRFILLGFLDWRTRVGVVIRRIKDYSFLLKLALMCLHFNLCLNLVPILMT